MNDNILRLTLELIAILCALIVGWNMRGKFERYKRRIERKAIELVVSKSVYFMLVVNGMELIEKDTEFPTLCHRNYTEKEVAATKAYLKKNKQATS